MNIFVGPQVARIAPDRDPGFVVTEAGATEAAYGADVFADMQLEHGLARAVLDYQAHSQQYPEAKPLVVERCRLSRTDYEPRIIESAHRQAEMLVGISLTGSTAESESRPRSEYVAAASFLLELDLKRPFHPAMESWLHALKAGKIPAVAKSLLPPEDVAL